MTNENIKLAIETLKFALKVNSNETVKNSLVQVVANMFVSEVEKTAVFPTSKLTLEEIRVGETEGKLGCCKLVKTRLNMAILDAKRLIEDEFERLGKKFYGQFQ